MKVEEAGPSQRFHHTLLWSRARLAQGALMLSMMCMSLAALQGEHPRDAAGVTLVFLDVVARFAAAIAWWICTSWSR